MLTFVFKCLRACKEPFDSIGEDPQLPDGSIKGEETDGAVTKVPRSAMDVVGLTGCKFYYILTNGTAQSIHCIIEYILSQLSLSL